MKKTASASVAFIIVALVVISLGGSAVAYADGGGNETTTKEVIVADTASTTPAVAVAEKTPTATASPTATVTPVATATATTTQIAIESTTGEKSSKSSSIAGLQPWVFWLMVGIVGSVVLVLLGLGGWFLFWRKPRPSGSKGDDVVADPTTAVQDDPPLLRLARGIADKASHGRRAGRYFAAVVIPESQMEIEGALVEEMSDLAGRMAAAQRKAELDNQLAEALLKGAEAITRSKERAEVLFNDEVVDKLRKAFETLGQTPPPMRNETEVLAAQRLLARDLENLTNAMH